jgi:hypothetical protein
VSKDIFAQYLQSLAIAGVKSMSLAFEQVHEQPLHMSRMSIEGHASWAHRYKSGFVVTLRGLLSVILLLQPSGQPGQPPTWTIDSFTFESKGADRSIPKEAVTSADDMAPAFPPAKDDPALSPDLRVNPLEPGRLQLANVFVPRDPCGAFGVPQAAFRCLEVRSRPCAEPAPS